MSLSNTALKILKSRDRSPGRELVFGAGKGRFSGWSKAKAGLIKSFAMSDRRLRCIRRTVVAGMVESGIQPHIIEAFVNHLSGHKGGVAGIYNRATYAAEKCNAMEKWADHLYHVVAKEKRDTQDS